MVAPRGNPVDRGTSIVPPRARPGGQPDQHRGHGRGTGRRRPPRRSRGRARAAPPRAGGSGPRRWTGGGVTARKRHDGTKAYQHQRAMRRHGRRSAAMGTARVTGCAPLRVVSSPQLPAIRANTHEPDGEQRCLLLEAEVRLDEERVGEEPAEAADVAGGEEEVGIVRARPVGPGVPPLQQRPRGRKHDEREADHHCERAQQPDGRGVLTRCGPRGEGERQRGQRQREHHQVHQRLAPWRQPARRHVRVEVAGEQQHLEEERAGAPDRRAAAVRREQESRDHRLHREQQSSPHEGGGREERHQEPTRPLAGRRDRGIGVHEESRSRGEANCV